MEPCTHRTANDFDACAPVGNGQYQCLLCGSTTSDFQEWVEIEQYVPEATPDRKHEDLLREETLKAAKYYRHHSYELEQMIAHDMAYEPGIY